MSNRDYDTRSPSHFRVLWYSLNSIRNEPSSSRRFCQPGAGYPRWLGWRPVLRPMCGLNGLNRKSRAEKAILVKDGLIFSANHLVRWASSPPTKGEQTGERIMNRTELAIRVFPDNPDHHLWNNNGTWWCHYTVHRPDYTKQRVRVSLGTRSHESARRLRDRVLQNATAA